MTRKIIHWRQARLAHDQDVVACSDGDAVKLNFDTLLKRLYDQAVTGVHCRFVIAVIQDYDLLIRQKFCKRENYNFKS